MPADHHPQPSSAEQQLRDLLSVHASRAAGNAHSLDAETVITRARRRRSPRQLAVAGATGLVLVTALAITVPALTQLGPDTGGAMDAATLAESDMEQRGHPPEVVDDIDSACFGTLEGTAVDGVDLTVEARTAAGVESGWTIDATVVVTNTGHTTSSVVDDSASFVIEQGGNTIAFFGATLDGPPTTLEPGESSRYAVQFTPFLCAPDKPLADTVTLRVSLFIDGVGATSAPITISSP